MLEPNTASLLAHYNTWAEQVLFAAIGKLPEDEVYRPTRTLFGSMIGTLNHSYQVDLIWRAHLLGQKHGFTTRSDVLHPSFEALVKAQDEVDKWFISWAQEQSQESLNEVLPFRFVSSKAGQMQRGGIFLHVINHKTYHRGWICEMFFHAGARPPQTDLTVYLCET